MVGRHANVVIGVYRQADWLTAKIDTGAYQSSLHAKTSGKLSMQQVMNIYSTMYTIQNSAIIRLFAHMNFGGHSSKLVEGRTRTICRTSKLRVNGRYMKLASPLGSLNTEIFIAYWSEITQE